MSVVALSKSLAGVAAVGVLVAWMMPPTKPKPLAPSPLAGLAPVKPMGPPPETAADAARVAMPPPNLAFATSPAETKRGLNNAPPPVVTVNYDDQSIPPPARQVVAPGT